MNAAFLEPEAAGLPASAIDQSTRRGRLRRMTGAAEPGGVLAAMAGLNCLAAGYWCVFWIMNGLDKFLNRSDIGLLNWHGKDRSEQFAEYFSRLDITPAAIDPVLYFAGLWELVVAVPLVLAIAAIFVRPLFAKAQSFLFGGYFLTGLTLIAFSAFDVIAGDRAELREHGLYLALLFVCCLWSCQQHRTVAR